MSADDSAPAAVDPSAPLAHGVTGGETRFQLLARVERHELVKRRLDMESGRAEISAGKWSDQLAFDGKSLVSIHGPHWRLLVVGAGQLSKYLAQMAQALDYHVTVCDPREEYADTWDVSGVELTRGMPDDVVVAFKPDANTAIVARASADDVLALPTVQIIVTGKSFQRVIAGEAENLVVRRGADEAR